MKHATFRQLRVFDAIVRNGSFIRAAKEMHLTQPTLSMQVKKISDSIGLPLFEQIGRKIYPTDAGRALHDLCKEVFDSIARFEMTLADSKGLKKGQLRLTAVTTTEYFLPRFLGTFCNRYPGIDVSLKILDRGQVMERLRANTDDLYIFGFPPKEPDIKAMRFLENPLVAVAPTEHPLATNRNIPLARLLEEPFLLREPGSGTRILVERFFAEHGSRPRVRMELGSNEAIRQAILGGLGLSILSNYVVENAPGLTVIDSEGFPIKSNWYLIRQEGKQLSVVARAFCDHLARATDTPELMDWS
ncbi:MAG: LysR family transcriptional regulator [Magnetococcus sp. YQC-5]